MKIGIVTTTINFPTFLYDFEINLINSEQRSEEINFIVVGDKKTPEEVQRFCENQSFEGLNVEYWDPESQDSYLEEFCELDLVGTVIPEGDIRCRNFGFLRALKVGSDIIVSLDDDNYPIQGIDWLGTLLRAFEEKEGYHEVASQNNIINPCNVLDYEGYVYSRGYPFGAWYSDSFSSYIASGKRRIMMHQMLWTNKPDIDSWSNLCYPQTKVKGFRVPEGYVGLMEPKLVAREGQYFPVDTQSLAFRKELAVFHALYQEPLFGLPSHRYDDIWAGLICQKLINHNGDGASFGAPLMEHRRNKHDFVKDLQTEIIGASLNHRMWQVIMDMELTTKGYKEGFREIADKLPLGFENYDRRVQEYIGRLSQSMKLWSNLIDKV